MQTSESLAGLAPAFAKAQGSIDKAVKESANDAFKRNGKASKYADLGAVWDACREALSTNGLSVVQAPGPINDNRMELTTMLLHSSGEWIRETLTIPVTKVDAQGYGSATTYARRYALAAMVGVAPDDDDGNAAVGTGGGAARQDDGERRIDDTQRSVLQTLAEQAGADMKGFCTYYRIGSLPELPASRFDHAKAMLNKKLAEKAGREGGVAQAEAA